MKKILNISIWIILILGLIVLLSFIGGEHSKIKCKNFLISIDYGDNKADYFITSNEIRNFVYQITDTLKGQKIQEIDIEMIESEINKIPYVAKADVYLTIDGIVRVNIIQRKAIVKIIDKKGKSFYIDETAKFMSLNSMHSAHVLIANGNFIIENTDTLKQPSITYDIFCLAKYISNDEFFNAQISQIYVNQSGEIELIPRVGNQVIVFGNIDNMKNKFEKLFILYQKGFKDYGWDRFKTINLKYENQIVCTKNI